MSDVARAAGLTRPTLYLSFADKQQIFAAVIETMVDEKLTEIRKGVARRKSFEAKLHFACISWSGSSFEILKAYPNAAEMFDFRHPVVRKAYDRFTDLLAELFETPLRSSGLGISTLDAARTVALATRGLREMAATDAELRQLIEAHVKLTAGAIEPMRKRASTRVAE
jgi:AcrR family transcriptional regulator